jgi:hypothetical protein
MGHREVRELTKSVSGRAVSRASGSPFRPGMGYGEGKGVKGKTAGRHLVGGGVVTHGHERLVHQPLLQHQPFLGDVKDEQKPELVDQQHLWIHAARTPPSPVTRLAEQHPAIGRNQPGRASRVGGGDQGAGAAGLRAGCAVDDGGETPFPSIPASGMISIRQRRCCGSWERGHFSGRVVGAPGGLTREVETPLPSNSPNDPMILRVDLVDITREVETPLPSNSGGRNGASVGARGRGTPGGAPRRTPRR